MPEDSPDVGITRYRFRIWPIGEPEPSGWAFDQIQKSETALRTGGVGLLAHHVDVTFGDVTITPVAVSK